MMFSILIAHYNNYEYFTDCYASILKQSFQDYEIIVVDDCSDDDSYEQIIALTSNDPKIKIFRNNGNQGVGYTKRQCVELAAGEICGFVDPDDALAEDALQVSVENHNKNNIAAYSSFYMCNDRLMPIKRFKHSRSVQNDNRFFFNIFFEVNHFFTFKKEAYFETVGINPALTSAVDQDLYLKLYEKGNFRFINKPLYFYRLHDKGVSQKTSRKNKLHSNWHKVILDATKRRNIDYLYKQRVDSIANLPEFLKAKQNNLFAKILRKLA